MNDRVQSATLGMSNASNNPELDKVLPESKWEFDATVAQCFDQMLERSIPSYGVMRKLTTDLAMHYLDKIPSPIGIKVVDLGASRGGAIADLVELNRFRIASFFALETSQAMLDVMRTRFATAKDVRVVDYDLRNVTVSAKSGPFRESSTDVLLSVLTLQFVPLEYRQRIMRAIYESLRPGGVFLYVEKVLGSNYETDDAQVKLYYDMKRANGYSEVEIQSKKTSLEGVLVPMTYAWHVDLLEESGFRHIDSYFRHLNFCGFMAVK